MLKELGRNDWLGMLDLTPSQVPPVLILRGTRNLQSQYEAARPFFSNVKDLGAPNGLIESVLVGEQDGVPVGFACVYGAAMASEVVHIFGAMGSRAVIHTGSCGALADGMAAGDLVVPTEACCGEGAAQYYAPGILRVRASPQIQVAKSLGGHPDLRVHEGPIYTTAALLAESEAQIAEWHHQGFIAVDMETATAFAVAESFGMWRASILYVFDNPWQREHLLLTDAVKDARRASTAVIARDLAFSIAVDLGRAGMMQRGAR